MSLENFRVHGLQKMTLLDFPGKVACTVFLGGCDFRCPFCHNAEILDVNADFLMSGEEVLKFLKTRQGLLEGVAITGGEPCLRKELPEFLTEVKALGYPVKLDTNGNSPKVLKELLDKKLVDYVAMDIKNDEARYAETAGLPSLDMAKIKESIAMIMESAPDYEFRTTVVDQLHDEESFYGIGKLIPGAKAYYLQAFTDRDTVIFSGFTAPEKEKMLKYLEISTKFAKSAKLRGVD